MQQDADFITADFLYILTSSYGEVRIHLQP